MIGRIMILRRYNEHNIRARPSPGTSCLGLYEITNSNSQQTVCLGLASPGIFAAKDSTTLQVHLTCSRGYTSLCYQKSTAAIMHPFERYLRTSIKALNKSQQCDKLDLFQSLVTQLAVLFVSHALWNAVVAHGFVVGQYHWFSFTRREVSLRCLYTHALAWQLRLVFVCSFYADQVQPVSAATFQ